MKDDGKARIVRSELMGFLTPDRKAFTFDVSFAGRWSQIEAEKVARESDAAIAEHLGFSPKLRVEPMAKHLGEIRSSIIACEERLTQLRTWLAEAEAPMVAPREANANV